MQSIPYLNTCERPLSAGNYAIPHLNTWGTPPVRVTHLYTTYIKNYYNLYIYILYLGPIAFSIGPRS